MISGRSNWALVGGLLAVVTATLIVGANAAPRVEASQVDSRWTPFRYFEGIWRGSGSGIGGTSKVDRSFRFVLDGNFLHLTTKAVFPPQEKNPKGEVHKDWGMISLDSGRDKFVLREFHTEKYVNTYVLEVSEDGQTFVYTTERIENMPEGWRARLTVKIIDADHFDETFEIAPPDKDFFGCSINRFARRVSSPE